MRRLSGAALESAVSAALLAEAHGDFAAAEKATTALAPKRDDPIPERRAAYDELHARYRQLRDSFGGLNKSTDLLRCIKALIEFKYAQQG